ncbi:hypothetical protein D3C85_1900650 [compost metagenome]
MDGVTEGTGDIDPLHLQRFLVEPAGAGNHSFVLEGIAMMQFAARHVGGALMPAIQPVDDTVSARAVGQVDG